MCPNYCWQINYDLTYPFGNLREDVLTDVPSANTHTSQGMMKNAGFMDRMVKITKLKEKEEQKLVSLTWLP